MKSTIVCLRYSFGKYVSFALPQKHYPIYFTKMNSKYSIYFISGKVKIKCHSQLDYRMHRKIAIIIIRKGNELLNYHIP